MLTYCSKYVMEVCLFVYYVLFMCVKSSVSATRQHQINESSLKKLWWLNNSLLASTFFFYRSHNLFSSFKSRLSERMSCKETKMSFTFADIPHTHLSNNRGGWNKCGGGAKVAKSLNVEVGINMESGFFWKKLVYN